MVAPRFPRWPVVVATLLLAAVSVAAGDTRPDDAPLAEQVRLVQDAIAAIDGAHYDVALARLERALETLPDASPGRMLPLQYMRALCLFHLGRIADAETPLRQALAYEPHFVPALDMLWSVFAQEHRFAEAADVLRTEIPLVDDGATRAPLLFNLALALRAEGHDADAVRPLADAHRLAPGDARFAAQLADVYGILDRPADADRMLAKRIVPAGDAAVVHMNLGVGSAKRGALADAESRFRRAIALDPGLARAHLYLAEVLLRRGQPGKAIPEFET